MTVNIRPARAEDAERCAELLQLLQGAVGEALSGGAQAVLADLLTGARGEVLVAEEDGLLLGLAAVSYNLAMRYGGEYCQLEELIVDPAARGKNAGGLLVQASITRARERGCAEYGLYLVATTEHNLPFYEKYGLERVGSELRMRLNQ